VSFPRVAAVILAAGLSRRMAPRNKLLVCDGSGCPMILRTARAVLASRAFDVSVVTGHQAAEIERVFAAHLDGGRAPRFVHAPGYRLGLSESLKAGIEALPAHADACLVCLGDMPLMSAPLLNTLMGAYAPGERRIVVPTCGGRRGNPVIWDRFYFPEILALTGDEGARQVLKRHQDHIIFIETNDEAVLLDFDTPDTLSNTLPQLPT
jgi:molybdenum cofactor cytidylyltransferase